MSTCPVDAPAVQTCGDPGSSPGPLSPSICTCCCHFPQIDTNLFPAPRTLDIHAKTWTQHRSFHTVFTFPEPDEYYGLFLLLFFPSGLKAGRAELMALSWRLQWDGLTWAVLRSRSLVRKKCLSTIQHSFPLKWRTPFSSFTQPCLQRRCFLFLIRLITKLFWCIDVNKRLPYWWEHMEFHAPWGKLVK